jgi:NAD-dependent dihydropyrimidine dehydrogenase PreA subunit
VDKFLQKYATKYTRWLSNSKIEYSSKVIPVQASLQAKPWILPTQQAVAILRDARSFALSACVCRTRYQRCDHPLEVCFLLNEMSDKRVEQDKARRVDIETAERILQIASQSGLVHMTLYRPLNEVFALCNCCHCCCHDLQLLVKYGHRQLVARAEYLAVTNGDLCTDCGMCIERCHFQARDCQNDKVVFNPRACYGCGVCVTTCPEQAITMAAIKR